MNTDTRVTIPTGGSFLEIVKDLFEQQQSAGILYENNGVTRANGLITALFEKDGQQWLQLENQLEVALDKLYAVNGTFRADYSEC
ncbi:MAG: hypothetical protein EOO01_22160 [Chitinophagaceae bacterium]|nr:MAG: hypothetical protein EOO01_22160 [Chitinophagaceae bacterium]